jgi:parallel beta-helix repeat protein
MTAAGNLTRHSQVNNDRDGHVSPEGELFPAPLNPNGGILYVGGNGPNNYTTIQEAIDSASDDDMVFVYDESSPYYENVVINKSISLIGEGKTTTCIDANENGTVIEINADNVCVKGFSIQHSGREFNAGINLFGDNCNVSHNIIINNRNGMRVRYTDNNVICDNEIRDNDDDNIQLYYTNNSTVQNNVISRVDGLTTGIYSVHCNNNEIIHNTVNRTYYGMYISVSTNTTIYANSVNSCRWKAIILTEAPDNIIKDNYLRQQIQSPKACDITLRDSPRCIIQNNTLYSGILINESCPSIILDNLVRGEPLVYMADESDSSININCGQIILVNCSNITVQSQNIQQTVRAIHLENTDNCTLFNNTLVFNRQGIICISSHSSNISHNIINHNKENGLSIDPSNNNKVYNNNIENNEDFGLIISGLNNTIANNKINFNDYAGFVYHGENVSIINNTVTRNKKGLNIRFLSNSNIEQNTIKQNDEYGISILDSTANTFTRNVLTGNEYGILLDSYCNKHTIINNEFRDNQNGLFIDDAYDNEITKNNFIDNEVDAFFQAYLCKAFFNKWSRNYWGQPKLIKIIWGTKTVIVFEHATRTYITFRLDYLPSLRPYDIQN